ncbi:hypothetical protein HDZ31DRAFT_85109 [Schizophyllum fasciatum]
MHAPSDEKRGSALADSEPSTPARTPSTTARALAHLAREFLLVVLSAYAILSVLLPALAYVLARVPALAVPDAAVALSHVGLLRVVVVCTAMVFAVYGAAVAVCLAARTYWAPAQPADLEKAAGEGGAHECTYLLPRRGAIAL